MPVCKDEGNLIFVSMTETNSSRQVIIQLLRSGSTQTEDHLVQNRSRCTDYTTHNCSRCTDYTTHDCSRCPTNMTVSAQHASLLQCHVLSPPPGNYHQTGRLGSSLSINNRGMAAVCSSTKRFIYSSCSKGGWGKALGEIISNIIY